MSVTVSGRLVPDVAVTGRLVPNVDVHVCTGLTVIAELGYRHVQTAPATVWNIPHGLVFQPNVTAIDSARREMWPGSVEYPTPTTVRLTFSAAVGGEAFLS